MPVRIWHIHIDATRGGLGRVARRQAGSQDRVTHASAGAQAGRARHPSCTSTDAPGISSDARRDLSDAARDMADTGAGERRAASGAKAGARCTADLCRWCSGWWSGGGAGGGGWGTFFNTSGADSVGAAGRRISRRISQRISQRMRQHAVRSLRVGVAVGLLLVADSVLFS